MRNLRLVYATKKAFEYVADHIHPMDAEEIFQCSGNTPQEAMRAAGSSGGYECLCIVDDEGIPYVAGGFNITGLVWFITTKEVDEFSLQEKLQVFKLIKQMRDRVIRITGYSLYNTVYKKNSQHLKLLRLLGAEFEELATNQDFLLFTIESKQGG